MSKRSCNRHDDCDKAAQQWLTDHPGTKPWQIPVNFHCYDDDCEDCFG